MSAHDVLHTTGECVSRTVHAVAQPRSSLFARRLPAAALQHAARPANRGSDRPVSHGTTAVREPDAEQPVQHFKKAARFALPNSLKSAGRSFLGLSRAREALHRLQPGSSRGISSIQPEQSDDDDLRRTAASVPAGCQPSSNAVVAVRIAVADAGQGREPSEPSAGTENCAPAAHATSVPAQLCLAPNACARFAQPSSHTLRDSNRPQDSNDAPPAAVEPLTAKPVLQTIRADVQPAPERKKAPARRKRLREITLDSSGSEGEGECSSDAAEPYGRPACARRKVCARRSAQDPQQAAEIDRSSDGDSSDSGAVAVGADGSGQSCVDSEDAEPALRSKRAIAKRPRKSDGKPTVADLRQQCVPCPIRRQDLFDSCASLALTGHVVPASGKIDPHLYCCRRGPAP